MIPKTIGLTPDNIWKIGEVLKGIREEMNISQGKISEAMESPQSMVSQMESNHKIPAIYTLINYCDCIGYDIVLVRRR